jgi:hypothetical protein
MGYLPDDAGALGLETATPEEGKADPPPPVLKHEGDPVAPISVAGAWLRGMVTWLKARSNAGRNLAERVALLKTSSHIGYYLVTLASSRRPYSWR